MSLRVRIVALVGGLVAAFIAVLAVAEHGRSKQLARLAAELRDEQARDFRRAMEILERPLREFAREAASATSNLDVRHGNTVEWNQLCEDFGLSAAWFVDGAGAVHVLCQSTGTAMPATLPTDSELARFVSESRTSFFQTSSPSPWQLAVRPLAPDSTARGWIVAGREWSDEHVNQLGNLLDAQARIIKSSMAPTAAEQGAELTTLHELLDVDRRVAVRLAVTRASDASAVLLAESGNIFFLAVAFGILLLAAVAVAMRSWVLRPLDEIRHALASEDGSAMEPLLARRDEFSEVARAVTASFSAKQALKTEIEERHRTEAELRASREGLQNAMQVRSRLARDLHDNVIQAIYAAGLGLESVRAQMSEDPFGAEGRMRACMASLNETIRQVRSYINDLEPVSDAETQPFASAVRALTVTMQELWPISFNLSIDDATARKLGRNVQIHALQIVRECISNAIRHGAATHVAIELMPQSDAGATMTVRDNGRGFDPVKKAGTGRGLVNISLRAREFGGSSRIESTSGGGTTVTVELPLNT